MAVQCDDEECTCDPPPTTAEVMTGQQCSVRQVFSPDETLSPASSTSSCSTCSSVPPEPMRNLTHMKRMAVIKSRETIHEEDEDEDSSDELDQSQAVISV